MVVAAGAGKKIAGGWKNPSMRAGSRRVTLSHIGQPPLRDHLIEFRIKPAVILEGRVVCDHFAFSICPGCNAWTGGIWLRAADGSSSQRRAPGTRECYCIAIPLALESGQAVIPLAEILGVSPHASRLLGRAGFVTVGDAVRRGYDDLAGTAGMGPSLSQVVWRAIVAFSGVTTTMKGLTGAIGPVSVAETL